jgi:methionine biosynthesis protein MetW
MASFPDVGRLDYTDYWRGRGFALQKKLREREVLLERLIPAGARVLDIGCGNSRLPVALAGKGCIVTVADISPIVLDAFREQGIPGFALDLDAIAEAEIPGEYDFIILSEVLEHTRNPEEILKALASHTERFALTVPNSAFYPFRLRLFFGGRFFKQWVYHPSEHLRFWSHADFLDWLSALGLAVEYAKPSNGLSAKGVLPFLKDVWPNLFGHQMVYICRSSRPSFSRSLSPHA